MTTRFRFVIGAEVCEFLSNENDESIREALEENYPDCTLVLEYCICIHACSCVNGHSITTSKWISSNPLKPWIGKRKRYNVPLEIVTGQGAPFRYYDPWN